MKLCSGKNSHICDDQQVHVNTSKKLYEYQYEAFARLKHPKIVVTLRENIILVLKKAPDCLE